jgi:hypothetical protein
MSYTGYTSIINQHHYKGVTLHIEKPKNGQALNAASDPGLLRQLAFQPPCPETSGCPLMYIIRFHPPTLRTICWILEMSEVLIQKFTY